MVFKEDPEPLKVSEVETTKLAGPVADPAEAVLAGLGTLGPVDALIRSAVISPMGGITLALNGLESAFPLPLGYSSSSLVVVPPPFFLSLSSCELRRSHCGSRRFGFVPLRAISLL